MPAAQDLISAYLQTDASQRARQDSEFEKAQILARMEMTKLDRQWKMQQDELDNQFREKELAQRAKIADDNRKANESAKRIPLALDQFNKFGLSPQDASSIAPEEDQPWLLKAMQGAAVPYTTTTPGQPTQVPTMNTGALGAMAGAGQPPAPVAPPPVGAGMVQGAQNAGMVPPAPQVNLGALMGGMTPQVPGGSVTMQGEPTTTTKMVSPNFKDIQEKQEIAAKIADARVKRYDDLTRLAEEAAKEKQLVDLAKIANDSVKNDLEFKKFGSLKDWRESESKIHEQRLTIEQQKANAQSKNADTNAKRLAITGLTDERGAAVARAKSLESLRDKYMQARTKMIGKLAEAKRLMDINELVPDGNRNASFIQSAARAAAAYEGALKEKEELDLQLGVDGQPGEIDKQIQQLRENAALTVNQVGKPKGGTPATKKANVNDAEARLRAKFGIR